MLPYGALKDLAMNEGDSDTEMAFRVYLSTPVYQTVRVKWTASTIAGNTATFGEDYAADHNSYTGHVLILAGQTENFINGIEITGDTIFEPDETFTMSPYQTQQKEPKLVMGLLIGTIINDDPEPTLSDIYNHIKLVEIRGAFGICCKFKNSINNLVTLM